MFFALSKVVWFLLTPSNLLLLLALAGLATAARARVRRRGLILSAVCLAALAGCGFGPVSGWLLLPLEGRFPPTGREIASPAGIIVLGGAVRPDLSFARGELNVGEAAERVIAMADLARRFPAARLVFTGGSGALLEAERAEADAVLRFAPALGIDPSRILVDDRSRTTFENAVETRRLVDPKPGEPWLLVTSAWHMPRAVGVFRQAGFDVVPYPVDYLTQGRRDLWAPQSRLGLGLDRTDLAAKEWAGLLAYRLSGRSDALFPGP